MKIVNGKHEEKVFYGTTTLGEKGQVVIPADARKKMHLKKGEKLLVFGIGGGALALTKLSHMEHIATELTDHLRKVQTIVKKHSK